MTDMKSLILTITLTLVVAHVAQSTRLPTVDQLIALERPGPVALS